ncbi:MAG: ZIP family metal transporter [Armatimonadota bacterium]
MSESAARLAAFSVVVVGVSMAGGLLTLRQAWPRRQLRLLISFGAGILLGAAFLHMLPQAIEDVGTEAATVALAGFLVLYVLEKFVMIHACEGEHCDFHTTGLVAFVGLALHAFVDGVALGSALVVPRLAPLVLVAIIAHKGPASLSLAGILLAADYTRRQVLALLTGFGLMVPLGAVVTIALLRGMAPAVAGGLIAFSAGTFVHVAASDLLPEVHRAEEMRRWALLTFVLGVGTMWLVSLVEHG